MAKFVFVLFLTAALILAIVLSSGLAKPTFFYETLIFLVFSTSLIYGYLIRAKKPEFFTQLYLLSMALKILAYGAYLVVVVLEDQAGAAVNVVFFMTTYFIFTVIEIAFLYNKIKRNSQP